MSFHYSNPFLFILIEEIKYKMRTDSFKSGNKKKMTQQITAVPM